MIGKILLTALVVFVLDVILINLTPDSAPDGVEIVEGAVALASIVLVVFSILAGIWWGF